VVDLNDRQRLTDIRYKLGTAINETLSDLVQLTHDYVNAPSTRRKNKIIGTLKNIMLEGTREFEFSATAATVLLTNPDYLEIKRLFKTFDDDDNKLWTQDFVNLEKEVEYCALI